MDSGMLAGIMVLYAVIGLVGYVLNGLALQAVFKKAGRQDAWAAWVPLYNWWVMMEVAGRPGWWMLLMMLPFVNAVILILALIDLAKSFNQGGGMTVLLILFPVIGFFVLGYGSAQYVGPAGPEGQRAYYPPQQPPMPPAAPGAPQGPVA